MTEKAGIYAKTPETMQKCSNSCKLKPDFHSSGSSADRILQLQRTAGNQAVQRLIKSVALQTKLRIGQPNDIYEQEADRVAEQVMRMPEPQAVSSGTLSIQRTCPRCEEEKLRRQPVEEEEEEELLQTKEISGQNGETTLDLESRINAIRGGGQPLAESERSFFEPRFGYDFSQVRVHTGAEAAEAARVMKARAFTMGNDVTFGEDQYSPQTDFGKKLLAHELTHVVQQSHNNRTHTLSTQMKTKQRKSNVKKTKQRKSNVKKTKPRKSEVKVSEKKSIVKIYLDGSQRVELVKDGIITSFIASSASKTRNLMITGKPTACEGDWCYKTYRIGGKDIENEGKTSKGLRYYLRIKGEVGIHSNLQRKERITEYVEIEAKKPKETEAKKPKKPTEEEIQKSIDKRVQRIKNECDKKYPRGCLINIEKKGPLTFRKEKFIIRVIMDKLKVLQCNGNEDPTGKGCTRLKEENAQALFGKVHEGDIVRYYFKNPQKIRGDEYNPQK